MGTWTYYHGHYRPLKNAEIKEEIIKREIPSCKVHAISIPTWGAAYVAYSNPMLADPNAIHALVVKIACNNSREIGFKTMGESELPYYFDCPKKILKMLSPTDDKYALEWRQECMKKYKKG